MGPSSLGVCVMIQAHAAAYALVELLLRQQPLGVCVRGIGRQVSFILGCVSLFSSTESIDEWTGDAVG